MAVMVEPYLPLLRAFSVDYTDPGILSVLVEGCSKIPGYWQYVPLKTPRKTMETRRNARMRHERSENGEQSSIPCPPEQQQ